MIRQDFFWLIVYDVVFSRPLIFFGKKIEDKYRVSFNCLLENISKGKEAKGFDKKPNKK
jgi:hypothetical protein